VYHLIKSKRCRPVRDLNPFDVTIMRHQPRVSSVMYLDFRSQLLARFPVGTSKPLFPVLTVAANTGVEQLPWGTSVSPSGQEEQVSMFIITQRKADAGFHPLRREVRYRLYRSFFHDSASAIT
jgi:hypothetical protein